MVEDINQDVVDKVKPFCKDCKVLVRPTKCAIYSTREAHDYIIERGFCSEAIIGNRGIMYKEEFKPD